MTFKTTPTEKYIRQFSYNNVVQHFFAGFIFQVDVIIKAHLNEKITIVNASFKAFNKYLNDFWG